MTVTDISLNTRVERDIGAVSWHWRIEGPYRWTLVWGVSVYGSAKMTVELHTDDAVEARFSLIVTNDMGGEYMLFRHCVTPPRIEITLSEVQPVREFRDLLEMAEHLGLYSPQPSWDEEREYDDF